MKILLSGCAGFIGSNFIDWIIKNHSECQIVGIDNLCTGFKENLHPDISFYEIDLVDHEAVKKVFEEHSFDYIVHLAAFAAESLSDFCRRHTYSQNVIASANLINCAINYGVKRFMFTSSIASYGDLTPPFREDMIQIPKDIYGLSKYVTEQDLRIAFEHHKLEFVVIRPFNLYGPRQSLSSRYRNVAGIFMNKLLNNQPLTIYSDGSQRRAFSYIDDILPSLWHALTSSIAANQTYNLGASTHHSVRDVADILINISGKGSVENLQARHEVKFAWSDITKAKDQLGFTENTDLQTGLRQMWAWAKDQKRQSIEPQMKVEIEKGLYSFWTT